MKAKRFLAILLALCMLASVMPAGLMFASADEAQVAAAISAIDAIGEVTYKSKAAIEAADDAWNALTDDEKAELADYGTALTDAKAAFQALVDAFDITINLSAPGANGNVPTKWIPNMTEDELAATAAALEDEYKLWYSNGVNLGITLGKTYNVTLGSWMDVSYRMEMGDLPNDNVAFPMHDRNPTSFVTVPFAGMAFTMDPYVAETWDFNIAIGEPFQYEGKTYQVYTTGMKFYDTKAYGNANGDGRSDSGTPITRWGFRPGSTNDDAIKAVVGDGWSFIYAYADWSMAHKWEGLNIGAPHADVAKAGDNTYYQAFYGPDGDAYILSTPELMAAGLALTIDDTIKNADVVAALEDSAYVITGDMAAVMADYADFFAVSGDLVAATEAGYEFENGTLTADGFIEKDEVAIPRVQAIIDALPAAADVKIADEAVIADARNEYDKLSDTAKAAVDDSKLVAAEEKLADLLNGPEEAIALSRDIAAIGTVTYKSRAALAALRARYDALDDSAKVYVTNIDALDAADAAFQAIIDGFTWQVTTNRPADNANMTMNGWLSAVSDDLWNATRADLADSAKYAYYNGRQIVNNIAGTSGNFDGWQTEARIEGWWHLGSERGPDNYNSQPFRTNYTVLSASFPGIGFASDSAMAQNWGWEQNYALGEYFQWNGKTYQIFWNRYKSYDSVEPVGGSGTVPAISEVTIYPNENAANDTDAGKDIFRYAYAKYSSDNRWAGLTYGVPQSEYATAYGDLRVQAYDGPQGPAYLLTTTELIEAAPTDVAADTYGEGMAAAYYAITGDMAAVMASYDDFFTYAGAMVTYGEDAIEFENGTLTADGFAEKDEVAIPRVQGLIDALPAAEDLQVADEAAIEYARAQYDALSDTAKAAVDASKLVAAEEKLDELLNGPEEAVALVRDIAALEVTYKSQPDIDALRARYEAMDEAVKPYITNIDALEAAEAELQALVDAFSWQVTATRPAENAAMTLNGWLATVSEDLWNATRADMADSVKYAYAGGRLIVPAPSGTSGPFDNWMTVDRLGGWWHLGIERGVDNYSNQPYRTNWTILTTAFPGIGFAVDSTYAQDWNWEQAVALGETFEMEGKTYQVFWNYTKSYDTTEPVGGSNEVPATVEDAVRPDERADATETGKNIFRYAYAKYASDNRWEGLTLGIPQSEYAAAAADNRYQKFVGPDGAAYLITTTALIEAAPTDAAAEGYLAGMDASYFLVQGALADVIAADDSFMAAAGAIESVSDTEIVFANGTLTAEGFEIDSELADQAAAVDAAIEALGEITSLEQKAAVEAARAQYDALDSGIKTLVTKLADLEAAEAAIKALEDAAAAAEVEAMIEALGEITSLDQAEAVEAARAAYEDLTAAQKALVKNIDALDEAENALDDLENQKIAAEVTKMIEDLGEITSLEQKEAVEAARAAYDELNLVQKTMISDETVAKLEAAEEKIAELEEPQYAMGDVDMNDKVDVADIMKLKALIMADKWSEDELAIGDMDDSKALDVGDIMAVKNIIMSA